VPEQVKRLSVVIGLVITAVVIARFWLIPPALIATDQHWAAAIARQEAIPVKFAGATACQDCHSDVAEKKAASFHKNLSCEGCHGPAAAHAEDPSALKPGAPRDRRFCPVCHEYDRSRPTGFPQVNSTAHNPLKVCVSCHNPHDPVPPTVPKACAACHAQIERTKSLSRHALLECTTCHQATPAHRSSPRTAMPTKPTTREFCGQCHGQGTRSARAPAEAPLVEIATHGGRNLCWDCHYPHLPEGPR
jgi:Cytochrome c7 and related cytochrome c